MTDLTALWRYRSHVPRDPVDIARVRTALDARWVRIDVVDETASTNADLLADATAPDRSVLVAEHQSAGRGRLDRSWTSPPLAGLTFSALLRPTAPLLTWGWLPLLAGVALHDAVAPLCDGTSLKWPNDLLIGDRKVAGVLAQTGGDNVVIGIGLNISTTEDELPVPAATSLAIEGCNADRTDVLVAVLTALDARYAQWADVRGDAEACGLAAAYRSACSTLGREVSVTGTNGGVVLGVARDLDASGRLVVGEPPDQQVIGAGDVEHLRPA